MKKVLVRSEVFNNGNAADNLQRILTAIISTAIKKKTAEEISLCVSRKTAYSHWIEEVLPGRITMLLGRPSDDKLLQESKKGELHACIHGSLFDVHRENTPLVLYFEIIERYFLLKRLRDAGPKHDKDCIEMIFYESVPEKPDDNLQEITRNLLIKLELLSIQIAKTQ